MKVASTSKRPLKSDYDFILDRGSNLKTSSAYHLNGIFGNNFSTNGTGRSAPVENGKEMNCTICESFSNAAKVWVQTNMAVDVSPGLQDS